MATAICVAGQSGTGKSTSIGRVNADMIGLDPKETVLINVMGKPLPFKGSNKMYGGLISEGGNYLATTDTETIIAVMQHISANRPEIKNIVLDDTQYIMSDEYMSKALSKGYEKFAVMAKHIYDVFNVGRSLRDDMNFIVLTHDDYDEKTQSYKIKTLGKMVDNTVNLAGLFTILLFTSVEHDRKTGTTKYEFITNKVQDILGNEIPAKSPFEMFDDIRIPNDLGLVIKKAHEYFN